MPYEGEFAGYRPLNRIVGTERVKKLLGRARVFTPPANAPGAVPAPAPMPPDRSADFVVAIDGSSAEVDVKNGYPGAKVGYCTVASVLLKMREIDKLDESRPVDPRDFRRTEEAATIDAALPGSNVVTRSQRSACGSFRQELYELFQEAVVDETERNSLLTTYEGLLALKPTSPERGAACPYQADGCNRRFDPGPGVGSCVCDHKHPVYSTDALRVHEGFRDIGTNGEAFGEVMQVCERVLLIHLLRGFEKRNLLDRIDRVAFFLDGPLAVFGHPAWLSAAIQTELTRLNEAARKKTGADLAILGIEKSGAFVSHFEELDRTETPGRFLFAPREYMLLTDRYIKTRVNFSDSPKRYGADTYFGRKFFYKAANGARIVATIPFLSAAQDTIESDDPSLYPQFGHYCLLLDKLTSCRYPNSLSPIVSAHAQAAIPLSLGTKVLEQLARALVRDE
jgi:hypothetical protein